MPRLGVRLARSHGDVVVNGFYRSARGLVADRRSFTVFGALPLNGSAIGKFANDLVSAFVQGQGEQVNDPVLSFQTWSGIGFADDADNVGQFFTCFRSVNVEAQGVGAPLSVPPLAPGRVSRLWIEFYAGRVRAWQEGALILDRAFAHPGLIGCTTSVTASGNPPAVKNAAASGGLVMRRRDIELTGFPLGTYVLATFPSAAPVRVDVDGAGAGVVPVPDGIYFPCPVTYEVHGTPAQFGAVRARLTVRESYGGDVITYNPAWDHSPPLPEDALSIDGLSGVTVLDWRAAALVDAGGGVPTMPAPAFIGHALTQDQGAAPSIGAFGAAKTLHVAGTCGVGFNQPLAHPDDFTAYIVAKVTAGVGAGAFYNCAGLYCGENSGNVADFGLCVNAAGNLVVGGYTASATGAGSVIDGLYHVFTLQRKKATGQLRALVDGVEVASVNFLAGAQLDAAHPFSPYLNMPPAGGTLDFLRFVAQSGADSDAQIASAVAQLRAKHGL